MSQKIYFYFGFIIFFSLILTNSYSQNVDFDNSSNWTSGSGAINSYQVDHTYTTTLSGHDVTFTGGEALRNTATDVDGFPGAIGTYSWRLRDVSTVEWFVILQATSIDGFSFKVRRYGGSPSPDFDVSYSLNGGNSYISVGTIDNTFLGNSSDWSTFIYNSSLNTDGSNLYIRFKANGFTERIMIDDFTFDNPLPVELTKFEVEYANNSVQLNWETATEINNAGFEVQRQNSETGTQNSEWEVLTFIPGHGTTNSPKYYSYNDEDLPNVDKVSYRLRQIDNDGTDAYSKTVEVELGGITSVEDEMLFEFALEQNYPNPFNPVTTINFTLSSVGTTNELSQQAKLTVYNLLGQEVRTLVNEVKPAGSYQIQFDASDLPSGIYFYSLTYGNHIQTRKLALLK